MTKETSPASAQIVWWLMVFFILQLAIGFLVIDGNTLNFDEAIWHYIGRNWFRFGLTPYSGGVDNKSPFMFMIYGLSDLLFGINYWFPRILGAASQTIGIFFLFKIVERKCSRETGLIAISIYGLSLLWKATGGKYTSFSESFEVPLLIAAFYFFLRDADQQKSFFVSGLLAGFAGLFRLTGFFGAIAIFISSTRKGTKCALLFVLGVLCSATIFIVVIMLSGMSIREIVIYGFSDNFASGSVTDHTLLWKLDTLINSVFLSELVLFLPGLIAYIFLTRKLDIFLGWFILAFIAINVIGLYARQHFRELLPSLSIMSAVSISYLLQMRNVKLFAVLTATWICFVPKQIEPWLAVNNLVASHNEPRKVYCKSDMESTADEDKKALGFWIKQNTRENDKVFIAGMSAIAQVYSQRKSPTIYFNSTQTPAAKQRLMQDLNNDLPDLILIPVTADYNRVDLELTNYISLLVRRGYENEGCKYNYDVFRRIRL